MTQLISNLLNLNLNNKFIVTLGFELIWDFICTARLQLLSKDEF